MSSRQYHVGLIDGDQWKSLYDSALNKIPFSTVAWKDSMTTLTGLRADSICVGLNDSVLAGIIIYYKQTGAGKRCVHPKLTPYNGIIFSQEFFRMSAGEQNNAITELSLFIRKNYIYPYFLQDPSVTDLRSFQWSGYRLNAGYTYVVDPVSAKPDSDIIRRAKRCTEEGFVLSTNTDAEVFRFLFKSTAERQGIKNILSQDDTKLLFENCTDLIMSFTAFSKDGDPHACWIQLKGGDKVFNWNAASNASTLSKGGTQFLVMGMLQQFRDSNIRHWDLCGADHPSVAKFKATIGGTLVPYFKVDYSGYSIFKKLRYRLA